MLYFLACTTSVIDTGIPLEPQIAPLAHAGADRYVEIHQPTQFSLENSTGASFTWSFGDGTTLHSQGEQVEHTYSEAGSYPVVLTAFTDDGQRHSDSSLITVHHKRTESPASWSSLVQLHADLLWFLFPEANSLLSMNLSSGEMSAYETCSLPRSISIYDSQIGVACEEDHSAQFFNTAGMLLNTVEFPVGSHPFGILGSEDGWFVSLAGTGELARIEANGIEEIITLGPDPRHITRLHDGTLAVPRFRSGPDGGTVYFWSAEGGVTTTTLDLDFGGDSDNTTGGVPNLLEHIIPSPDGRTLYLPFSHANTLRGEFINGKSLTFESMLRGVLATLKQNEQGHWIEDGPRKQLDERGRSLTVVPNYYGDRLYVLHPGAEQVSILDGITLQIRGSVLDAGTSPMALAWSEEKQTLFIYSWLDRTIIAMEVVENQLSETWRRSWTDVSPEPLDADLLLGKQLFYSARPKMSKAGYIACAHCHPDGTQDGLVWDFTDRGEGLRNTTSLLGNAQTGMIHWSGNFDEIQDFETDIRTFFGGEGLMAEEDWLETAEPLGPAKTGLSPDLDALAAYIESLQAPLPSPYPASEEGYLVFEDLGCVSCHPPPLYTDSSSDSPIRHDIGTLTQASGMRLGAPLDGLDTPSLLGIYGTAPYLHDGSAQSLEDAVLKHSSIDILDEETKSLLLSFLLSL